ncbi:MAG: DUF3800 domain-containing protein [bacterium]|nr:DUF3800 domain-containing protein [bacterium]
MAETLIDDSAMVTASSLLVFVDETGDESLQDPAYRVFGLGGCAMRADTYFGSVKADWRRLKAEHFDGEDEGLHACSVDPANIEAVGALGEFFRSQTFSRFGVNCFRGA